jgi:phage terminase large subunit
MNEIISTTRLPDIRKTIKLLPKQYEFIRSPAKEILLSSGYGGGKSMVLCYKAIQQACIPGNVVLIVRKTMVSLKKSTLMTLIGDTGVLPAGTYEHYKQDNVIKLNGAGQIIYCGLDDFQRIRSMNLGCVIIDEVSELNATEYQELLYRLRLDVGSRQLCSATNPATKSHFLWKRFFKDLSPFRKVIQCCSLDNHHLPSDYIESLKQMDGIRYAKYVNGEWVSLENSIYENFNRDLHVKPLLKTSYDEYYMGGDIGYRDPTCLLVIGRIGDKLRIIEENYRSKMMLNEIKTSVVDLSVRYPGIHVILDPSEALIHAELQSIGISSIRANNDIATGINRVRTKLINRDGSPSLLIDESCLNCIREFESYQYQTDREKPAPYDDHSMDALRYVVNYIEDQKCQYSKPLLIDMNEEVEEDSDRF